MHGKFRRYEKMDVASYLVCDVTFDATKRYIKLQHEDQLQLDLWLPPFSLCGLYSPQLATIVACCECRHSGAYRNPVVRSWTPAFAGVT